MPWESDGCEFDACHVHMKLLLQVGVFPEFAGVEYENFMAVAEKKRSDYDFFHTSDASILPRGDQTIKGPVVRLFKPFDELFADSRVHSFFMYNSMLIHD